MRVWIVGNFKYPYGEAASTRVTLLARALLAGEHDVCVATTAPSDSRYGSAGSRDGVPFFCLSAKSRRAHRIISGAYRFVSGPLCLEKWISRSSVKPDLVISYGASAWLGGRLLKWSRRTGVPVVFDVVEWYEKHQCVGGYFGPFFYDSELFFKKIGRRAAGIIAISAYLEHFFTAYGCPIVRIPALVDTRQVPPRKASDQVFTVLYSGFPGKKDLLAPILDAARQLRDRPVRFLFTGRDLMAAFRAQGITESCLAELKNVEVKGWLSETELREVSASADAMIILRSPGRSSLANFPQKFAEYMASGRPVLINKIGDMASYVRDRENGLLLGASDGASIAEAVSYLLSLPDRGAGIGRQAAMTAQNAFDFRLFSHELTAFIERVVSRDAHPLNAGHA